MKKILKNYLYGLLNPQKPSYVSFYVNNICQLRCDMCFYWDSMQKKTIQLNLDEITKLSLSLPNILQLSFTGGEPTLRKDLVDVVTTFCQNSNVAKSSIITNGFITERVLNYAKEILRKNPSTSFRFCVSIDGQEEVHDTVREVKNSYKNAIITVKELKQLKKSFNNLHVDINTTVSKFNYNNFFNFVNEDINQLKPDHHTISMTRGITKEKDAKDIPLSEANKIYNYIISQKQKYNKLEHKLIRSLRDIMYDEIKRVFNEDSFKYYCTAGKKYLTIYQDGNVAACEILGSIHPGISPVLGNLKDFDFDCKKLLKNSTAKNIQKFIKKKKMLLYI